MVTHGSSPHSWKTEFIIVLFLVRLAYYMYCWWPLLISVGLVIGGVHSQLGDTQTNVPWRAGHVSGNASFFYSHPPLEQRKLNPTADP